jgi:nucleotide-binding universal stress UspA family protein
MNKNVYLVLHDFTSVGDSALNYAVNLSSNLVNEIKLVHLVSNKKDIASANSKLNDIISKVKKSDNTEITSIVKEGSIFEDIAKIVKEEKINLIIMGTHGAKGMQKIFGSHAMKVITSSDVPFFVIQNETQAKNVKRILVPIDLEKESLQIIDVAGDIAKMYDAEVFLVAEKREDPFLSQKIKNRILLVRKQYEERQVKCIIELLPYGGSYQKKIMNYCTDKQIDLLAIAYHSTSILPQFDTFAQDLITNPDLLPCVIINSKITSTFSF